MKKPHIRTGHIDRLLLLANMGMALLYFSWWFIPGRVGNPILYYLLVFGEGYHVLMAFLFWMTMWPSQRKHLPPHILTDRQPRVDVFITVAGEPEEIVEKTALAAKNMKYQNHTVYILNDGYVAKKLNWQVMEKLAEKLGINCITRTTPGGAKAGNINHGLKVTSGEIIVIFDADMVPHPDFLEKMIPYFQNPKVGFVQSPQFYNNAKENEITRGAWEQQEFFFGPIMRGKDRYNTAFICGTNVAIRRPALEGVGGMYEKSIAEDFLTSLFIHQKKWQSYYIPEVLAEGLAPEDLLSYYKQQFRWARGSLDVLFTHNPLFTWHLSIPQKLQYLSSALYYFNGVIVLIDIIMPLIFFFFGIEPVTTTTTSFALYFIPFMYLNLYTLYKASDESITFRAISFSQSSFVLQLQALFAVITRQNSSFSVTAKKALNGNFLFLAYPHIAYILLTIVGIMVSLYRSPLNASVAANIAWAMFNIFMFLPFIQASYQWNTLFKTAKTLEIATK